MRVHRLCSRAEQQRIAVAKVVLVVEVEILGRHVAVPPVMASLPSTTRVLSCMRWLTPRKSDARLSKRVCSGAPTEVLGIDADVDVRVPRQRQQRLVRRMDHQVIDDHANPHATIRRAQQRSAARMPMLSVLQMKYCTSIERCACSTSHARASNASARCRAHERRSCRMGRDLGVDEGAGAVGSGQRGRRPGGAKRQGHGQSDGPVLNVVIIVGCLSALPWSAARHFQRRRTTCGLGRVNAMGGLTPGRRRPQG